LGFQNHAMILLVISLAADWMAVVSRMPEPVTISPRNPGILGSCITTSIAVYLV